MTTRLVSILLLLLGAILLALFDGPLIRLAGASSFILGFAIFGLDLMRRDITGGD